MGKSDTFPKLPASYPNTISIQQMYLSAYKLPCVICEILFLKDLSILARANINEYSMRYNKVL